MWLINLSLVDWLSRSDDDKTLNAQMRLDWLASYRKASEAVLQHWFWKLLKTKTLNFAASPSSLKLLRTSCVWAVTLPTTTTFESTFLCLYIREKQLIFSYPRV